jgi:hypothetical protein
LSVYAKDVLDGFFLRMTCLTHWIILLYMVDIPNCSQNVPKDDYHPFYCILVLIRGLTNTFLNANIQLRNYYSLLDTYETVIFLRKRFSDRKQNTAVDWRWLFLPKGTLFTLTHILKDNLNKFLKNAWWQVFLYPGISTPKLADSIFPWNEKNNFRYKVIFHKIHFWLYDTCQSVF